MKYRLALFAVFVITLGVGLFYSCGRSGETPGENESFRKVSAEHFVGEQECSSCHAQEVNDWRESHHDYAMAVADSATVRGDFSNVKFNQDGDTYRFFRRNGRYMVEAPGSDGQVREYEVTHTFGWTPLQQYLVDFGKGKLQALNVAWDTREERWFSMHPEEEIGPGDWLHWSGGAMNWNSMCADCHSTQLEENYIPESDSFHTTWSSINVSCEACHGPGKQHVEFMRSEKAGEASQERIRKDLDLTGGSSQIQQIEKCARCHALREKLVDYFDHDKEFMDHFNPDLPRPEMYFADGQIREEVYVYGSFLQSKMFQQEVECSDCHDPHSLELKANVTDNTLCMQCHEPSYDTPEHTKHKMNTEASQCINCHMTGRYYMEVDYRRDHSFRVPRPDLSAKFGTPNACNDCHDSKSPEWAAQAVKNWYGTERPDHFSETLLKADSLGADAVPDLKQLIADTTRPDIARATAIWYLGQFPTRQSVDIIKEVLDDESAMLRKSGARALSSLPKDIKQASLIDLLDDPVRAVRIAAVEGLLEFNTADMLPGSKQTFKTIVVEYREFLDVNQYFPNGQLNRGQFFEKRGNTKKAIQAYRGALEKDPQFNPARINLAYLYNEQGEKARARDLLQKVIDQEPNYGPAYYSLALLVAEQGDLEKAASRFNKAAELMPDHARVRYNLAITHQKLRQPEKAEKRYLEAIERAPEQPEYRYGICTLYLQQGQPEKALPHAKKFAELEPNNRRAQKLLQMVRQQLE